MMLLILIGLCFQTVASELIHVHVLYRHGDRSPVVIYPNDIHKEDTWTNGLGQLTHLGMNQHFQLGQFLRKRYNTTLQNVYNVSEIYVRSTNVDRTLMSAESDLAGLYFPHDSSNQFNKDIKWNPVPIHTVPEVIDSLLYGGELCPRVNQLMAQVIATPYVQNVQKGNVDFFTMLQEKTGMSVVNLTNIWEIVDTTICEKAHNLSLPTWLNSSIWSKARYLDDFAWNLRFSNLNLRRLRGGVLVYQILNHLQALSRSDPAVFNKGSKMIMYSGHDFTVSDFMASAHIHNGLQPPYAAAVFIELHRINNEYVVEFYFRNDSTHDPYPLTMKGCSRSCPVDQVMKLLSPEVLHPDDYQKSCVIQEELNYLSRDLSYSFGFLCIAGVLCVLVVIMAYIYRQSRYRRYRLMGNIQTNEGDL